MISERDSEVNSFNFRFTMLPQGGDSLSFLEIG